jgi:hypothetical protein
MTETSDDLSNESPTFLPARRLTQLVVIVACAVCFLLFWWMGHLLEIPLHRKFEVSLLQRGSTGSALLAMLATMVLYFVCTFLADLIASRHWPYAGPFAASIGLSALSMRGGPSRYVYLLAATHSEPRGVFLMLALELLLLSCAVGLSWVFIIRKVRLAYPGESTATPAPPGPAEFKSLVAAIVIAAVAVMLLTPVDVKKEAMAAVFIAGFASAAIAEHYFRQERLLTWYWAPPLLVGLLGYLLNYAANALEADGLTGHVAGTFAALARPLPLDYASFGVAGAMLGFWMGGEHLALRLSRPPPPTDGAPVPASVGPPRPSLAAHAQAQQARVL